MIVVYATGLQSAMFSIPKKIPHAHRHAGFAVHKRDYELFGLLAPICPIKVGDGECHTSCVRSAIMGIISSNASIIHLASQYLRLIGAENFRSMLSGPGSFPDGGAKA